MSARYRVKVDFERDDGRKVAKGQEIDLSDQEADSYLDAGWIKLVEEAEGEKPDETAPPVPPEPSE